MPNFKRPRKSLSVAERDRRKLAALENAHRLLQYKSTNNAPPSNLPPPSDCLGNEDDVLAGVDLLTGDSGAGVDPGNDWRMADDEASFDSRESFIPPEVDSDEDDGEEDDEDPFACCWYTDGYQYKLAGRRRT